MTPLEYRLLVSDVCRFVKEHYPVESPSAPVILQQKKTPPPPLKTAAVVPPKKLEKPKVSKEIQQEKAPSPIAEPMEEFYQLVQRTLPHMRLRKTVPDDREAKQRAEAWKEKRSSVKVALLAFYSSEHELAFLKKLAKAIHQSLAPVQLIHAQRMEKEKKWETLLEKGDYQLVLSFPGEMQRCYDLMRFYKENPRTKERFLGKVPFLLLTPLPNYLENAESKRQLWSQLCQILKKSSTS